MISTLIIASLILPIFIPWGNLSTFSRYNENEYKIITLLVEEDMYNNSDLKDKIIRYAQDVQNSYAETKVSIIAVAKEQNSEEVYRILENFYWEGQKVDDDIFFLSGIIIIGDVVLPELKSEVGNMPSIFPYTDFQNPSFIWDTEDKKWIENPHVYAPSAEILHGVIPGTVEQISKFFDKNHEMHENLTQDNTSDYFRDEILFWNSKEEAKSMQKILLSQYEKGQDLMHERKSLQYNTELLKALYEDLLGREDFSSDIPDEIRAMYPKDKNGNQNIFLDNIDSIKDTISGRDLDGNPDRYTKDSIEKLLPAYADVVKRYESDTQEFIKNTGRWDQSSTDSIPETISLLDQYVGNKIQNINKIYEAAETKYFKRLDAKVEIYDIGLTPTNIEIVMVMLDEADVMDRILEGENFREDLKVLKNVIRWVKASEPSDKSDEMRSFMLQLEEEFKFVNTVEDIQDRTKVATIWNKAVANGRSQLEAHKEALDIPKEALDTPARISYAYINGRRNMDITTAQDCSLYRGEYSDEDLYEKNINYYDWYLEKKNNIHGNDTASLSNARVLPKLKSKSVKHNAILDGEIMRLAHDKKDLNKLLKNCSIISGDSPSSCAPAAARVPVFSWTGGVQIHDASEINFNDLREGIRTDYKNFTGSTGNSERVIPQFAEASALACQKITGVVYKKRPYTGPKASKVEVKELPAWPRKFIPSFIIHNNPSTSSESEKSLSNIVSNVFSAAMGSNNVIYADLMSGLTKTKYIRQTVPNFFRYHYKKALESPLVTQYELSRIAFNSTMEMMVGNGVYNRNIQPKPYQGVFLNTPVFNARRVVKFDEKNNKIETSDAFITVDDYGKIPAEYELEVLENMIKILEESGTCNNLQKFDSEVLIPKMFASYIEYFKTHTKIPGFVSREFILGVINPSTRYVFPENLREKEDEMKVMYEDENYELRFEGEKRDTVDGEIIRSPYQEGFKLLYLSDTYEDENGEESTYYKYYVKLTPDKSLYYDAEELEEYQKRMKEEEHLYYLLGSNPPLSNDFLGLPEDYTPGTLFKLFEKTWEHKLASELLGCDVSGKIEEVRAYIQKEKSATDSEKTKLNLNKYFLKDLLTEKNVEINSSLNSLIDFTKITANTKERYWQWEPLTTVATPEFARLDISESTIPKKVGKIYFETFEIVPNPTDVFYKYVPVGGKSFLGLRKNSEEISDVIFETFARKNLSSDTRTKEMHDSPATKKNGAYEPDRRGGSTGDGEYEFYDKKHRIVPFKPTHYTLFWNNTDLTAPVPNPNTYPEEIFHTKLKDENKDAYDKKLKEQNFLFFWNEMTAQDKHDMVQKVLLSKNQEIIPPLQEKNKSKPYAYAHWNIEGESSPEWKGEENVTSSLLGIPTSDYSNSSSMGNSDGNSNNSSNTDKNGTEQDETCGSMDGVPLYEWLNAVQCWLNEMSKLSEKETKKVCNLSLEEFKKLNKDNKDTKNAVEKIELTPRIQPFLPDVENTIIISFKTKEDKLAFGHDIRFTVFLENAKMRDVINDYDKEKDGVQLINRTGEEVIDIIPIDNAEDVKISIVIDSEIRKNEEENSELEDKVTLEKTFSVIPNTVDILQLTMVSSDDAAENGVKRYGLKVDSPIDFTHFDKKIRLSVSPHEESVLSNKVINLNEEFFVAVKTDKQITVSASIRGTSSISIDLDGDESVKTNVAEIQIPELVPGLPTLDSDTTYYFDVRYLNAMGNIISKKDDVALRIISDNSEDNFKQYELTLVENDTRVKIETHSVVGDIVFKLGVGAGENLVVNEFKVFIGLKTSIEKYEELNLNALYATITGLNNYGTDLKNHFATKMLHSSDNLNVITTQIIAPKTKKPIARMFANGSIETFSSGYRANILNLSPIEIGIFDKKEMRYKGQFHFSVNDLTSDDLYLKAPVSEPKGIFFEQLDTSESFIVKKIDDNIVFLLDNSPVIKINTNGDITVIDNSFRVELYEEKHLDGLSFLVKGNDTNLIYGNITIRGGGYTPFEDNIWVHSESGNSYFVIDTKHVLVDLFPMYQTHFSKSVLGTGFKGTEKYVLEYAAGNTVGEATKSSADIFMINIGDPSLSIPPPIENSTGFNETVGTKILEEEEGIIKKIIPLDFDGDGQLDMAEVRGDGYINILLNTGNSSGGLKDWGKVVRIDSHYKMIAKLSIKENENDVYDDLIYSDIKGKFHHIKNINGVLTTVDNPSYFPDEILASAAIEDLNLDGFSDIIGITEHGDLKVWYGSNDYFVSDPVILDHYSFSIPESNELKKSVLINFKNIETLSDLLGGIKRIAYLSNVKEIVAEEGYVVSNVTAENQVLKKYENRALSDIQSEKITTGLGTGVIEKPFLNGSIFEKSLQIEKQMIAKEESNDVHIFGKKYITQINITSKDTKDVTFTIADLYGELLEIDQFSVMCKYADTEKNTCGENYGGETFPTVSRAVIFENITLKPGQEVILSYTSFIKKLPKSTVNIGNLNSGEDSILDIIIKNKNNNWILHYISEEEKIYKKVNPSAVSSDDLDARVSNGIDTSVLESVLETSEISDAILSELVSEITKIHKKERDMNNAIDISKHRLKEVLKTKKDDFFYSIKNVLEDLLNSSHLDEEKIRQFSLELLDYKEKNTKEITSLVL
ncbi:TPA: hypothetical protein EYG84_02065, partial [Candidatus Gracilibacteria bacterium]|nr:hypothetical protein [Candidatus Gracilibacteria bacterium]